MVRAACASRLVSAVRPRPCMMHSLARFAISTHCLILAISLHLPQCQCKQTVFELSSHIQVRTPQDPHTAIGRAPFEGKQHCGRTSMQRASSNSSLAPILAGSPHVDFTTMSFPVEQNRRDQGVRGRSIPPLLNVSLYCNLLHFGREGRRSGMTHWRAGLGGKRPTHRPFLRISTRWWANRATEPPTRRGSKCFQITSAHIAGNISSDAAASLSSSHSQTQVTYWRVNFGADDPSRSHFSKYRPSDGSIRRPNPYSTPAPILPGNGNLYSWEYKQRCCSIASNLILVGQGDPLAGRFREK
jgi:hypothetical protein